MESSWSAKRRRTAGGAPNDKGFYRETIETFCQRGLLRIGQDRNPFVLVLIDGDGMIVRESLPILARRSHST
jgi:hypothetical protein